MQTIYFRTDGNEEIATGHIMRCLSIARACVALHAEVCFLVSDEKSMAILEERFTSKNEFPVQCLYSNYRNPEEELPALQKLFAGQKQYENSNAAKADSWLFVDSYFVTKHYLTEVGKLCKVAYLDDMVAFAYPVDLIINYDVTTEPACYGKAAHSLLGAAYTPLREQFQSVPYEVRPQVQHILLSTGGTDMLNVAGTLLQKIFADCNTDISQNALEASPSIGLQACHYHILTSRLNTHYKQLKQLAIDYPVIHIHENVQDMASLMCQCDLGISAGGTTLYELCAIGIPSVSFSMADNQLTATKTFSSNGLIPYAGDVRTAFDQTINSLISFLGKQRISMEERQKSSRNMRAFIDGKGSKRIAQALITL